MNNVVSAEKSLIQTNPTFPLSMLTQYLPLVKGLPKEEYLLITEEGVSNLAMIAQVMPVFREHDFWIVAKLNGDVRSPVFRIEDVTFDTIYESDVLVKVGYDERIGFVTVKDIFRFINTETIESVNPLFEKMLCDKLDYAVMEYFFASKHDRDQSLKYILEPTIGSLFGAKAPEIAFCTNTSVVNNWKERLLGIDPFHSLYAVSIDEFMNMHRHYSMHDEREDLSFYYGVLDTQTFCLDSVTYTSQEPLFLVEPELVDEDGDFRPFREFKYPLGRKLLVVFGSTYGSAFLGPLVLLPDTSVETWDIPPEERGEDEMILVPVVIEDPSSVVIFSGEEMMIMESDPDRISTIRDAAIAKKEHVLGPVYKLNFNIIQSMI